MDPAVERGCCCCCCCCGSSTLTLVGLMQQQQHCLVKEKEVVCEDGACEEVTGENLLGKPELYTPSLVRRGIDLCFEMKLRLCRWKKKCGGRSERGVPVRSAPRSWRC